MNALTDNDLSALENAIHDLIEINQHLRSNGDLAASYLSTYDDAYSSAVALKTAVDNQVERGEIILDDIKSNDDDDDDIILLAVILVSICLLAYIGIFGMIYLAKIHRMVKVRHQYMRDQENGIPANFVVVERFEPVRTVAPGCDGDTNDANTTGSQESSAYLTDLGYVIHQGITEETS